MRTTSLAIAPFLVLGAACSSREASDAYKPKPPEKVATTAVTPGSEASLMPLDQGNQWTYAVEAEARTPNRAPQVVRFDLTWKVTSSKPIEGGTEATIVATRNGVEQDRQVWRMTKKGLYQIAVGNPPVAYSTPQPVIVFPIKDGGTFGWKGKGPTALGVGTQNSSSTMLGIQEVDTQMGRFSAIPVESRSEATAGKISGMTMSTAWFSPGVGLVRFRQEALVPNGATVMLMKLKSKSLRSAS